MSIETETTPLFDQGEDELIKQVDVSTRENSRFSSKTKARATGALLIAGIFTGLGMWVEDETDFINSPTGVFMDDTSEQREALIQKCNDFAAIETMNKFFPPNGSTDAQEVQSYNRMIVQAEPFSFAEYKKCYDAGISGLDDQRENGHIYEEPFGITVTE